MGTILDDFGIILGSSDRVQKVMKRVLGTIFVNCLKYSVSLDEKRTTRYAYKVFSSEARLQVYLAPSQVRFSHVFNITSAGAVDREFFYI